MDGISGEAKADPTRPADGSVMHRARSVLAIRPFRRLWAVTYLCSMADWLSLLALSGLAAKLTDSYFAGSFAFAGVVLTQMLPGLLLAPLGGLFADRFDRRKVMACADIARCGLFFSIALAGSTLWLFVGNFLIGCCAMMWIPAKDAAVPNLLRRPDQVETANQLGMVMTYGIAVITGAGAYSLITGVATNLNLQPDPDGLGIAKIILTINGLLYLGSAIMIAFRIPELSKRSDGPRRRKGEPGPGFGTMAKDAARFVRTTPLVRGLLIGMIGAFAASGALIGSAQRYAVSLRGGESSFGLLFVALFAGLAVGLAGSPKLAMRLPHNRLFGLSIVTAALLLIVVALSPHLAVSLVAVALLGAGAGAAFLTGMTIIGTQIEDSIRGRINAIYQSMMKVILALSLALTPLLVGLVKPHTITVFGRDMQIDGTRPVLLGAGLLALLVGVIAYRQMDDRRSETILADLFSAIRGKPRRATGLLITVEGDSMLDTSTQAKLLTDWLRGSGRKEVLLASDPLLDETRLRAVMATAGLSSPRSQALVAAAVRADLVEKEIRPALDRGALVVMERFVDSPLAQMSARAGLDSAELEGLADWATARLRPDLTVLLDHDPGSVVGGRQHDPDQSWQVHSVLTEMASADPDRYIVIDGDGPAEEVAERVQTGVRGALAGRRLAALVPDVAPAEAAT